jgi:hypothetical protein
MIEVITTNKKPIDSLDISYVDVLKSDGYLYVYVYHFRKGPTVFKFDENTDLSDVGGMTLNELIKKERRRKIDKINNNIKSEKNIFTRLLNKR